MDDDKSFGECTCFKAPSKLVTDNKQKSRSEFRIDGEDNKEDKHKKGNDNEQDKWESDDGKSSGGERTCYTAPI